MLDHGAVGQALGLEGEQILHDVHGGNLRQFIVPQGGIDPPVEEALEAGPGILTHGDRFGGHEDGLPIVPQRGSLAGGQGFLGLDGPLLSPGVNPARPAVLFKEDGDPGELPFHRPAAPALWRIPPSGVLLFWPQMNHDLIKNFACFSGFLSCMRHFFIISFERHFQVIA